jgi:uncharacterized protein YciI
VSVFVYDTRVEFDTYTFVLLRRGPRAHEFTDEELEEIQAGHLAFRDRMRKEGHLLLAGPFRDQEDETKRGLCVYRTGLDETRRLTEQDPAIKVGRMKVEAMTWLTGKGALE